MARPALEVADVFRDHGAAWRHANRGHVSLLQLKVMSAIENCRTAALGGHVARCEDCAHTTIAYNSCLMGNFRNGDLATGLGRQSSVFQMLRRRSACLLLSITTVARRDRPTGDRAPGRHRVFAACRRGSDSGNLRPPKSACAVDPDEKLEAIEATGPPALRKRPFVLRTADCRPKGWSVMESQISKIYAPSNAAGRQLPITEFAHKAGNGRCPLPAATGTARSARARQHASGWRRARPSCSRLPTSTSSSRCLRRLATSPTRTRP